MKRQTAIIASAIFAFALVAVLIAADRIPIGVVTVVNGTGGGNLTVSGTGGTDQLLTWDTDTTGHWTSGISSFGVTNLSVLSSMSINITNQVLETDGSGNVVGGGDPFVWTSRLADNATNISMLVDTISPWTPQAYPTVGPMLLQIDNSGVPRLMVKHDGSMSGGLGAPFFGSLSTFDDQTFYHQFINTNLQAGEVDIGIEPDPALSIAAIATSQQVAIPGLTGSSYLRWGTEALGPVYNAYGFIGSVSLTTLARGFVQMTGQEATFAFVSETNGVALIPYSSQSDPYNPSPNLAIVSSGDLFRVQNESTNVFTVAYDGSTYSAGTNFANYVYVTNDCSALTFTDRSRSPSSMAEAYRIVKSHATKNGQVDHDKLDKLAQGKTKDTRDLGMVISAQQMVIQDLLTRIEKLEKK